MFGKININTWLKKTLNQVEEMGREIQNVQMLPRPAQIPMFLPLQWEKSKWFWPSILFVLSTAASLSCYIFEPLPIGK